MTARKTSIEHINPRIIKWARERCGLSVEELARKMGQDPTHILLWEDGAEFPSYTSLEDLAYRHLKIPLAVFFFPEPPEIEDPRGRFRRLPDYELARLSSDTFHKVRLAQGYQESLAVLSFPIRNGRKVFRDIKPRQTSPGQLAEKVRQYLGLPIERQFTFKSTEQAFKAWRHILEQAGVFTFKDSLADKFVSGFSLLDDDFPIIFINNSNTFTRQTFTLAHELGHILYGIHGITDVDETYLNFMSSHERSLEIKCNKFAAELLVPERDFIDQIASFSMLDLRAISDLAEKFSVSREVILRRLLDLNRVDEAFYKEKSGEWNEEYIRTHGKSHGGNYYPTRIAYLGEGFARLAFASYHQGRLSRAELATHLNVKARNIEKLERYLGW